MFDDNTKAAWQGITPSADLKQRVLAQSPAMVVTFPTKKLSRLTGMAACLMLALVLVFPAPRAEFAGVQPPPRMATMSLKETAAPLAELALEWDGKSELTVSGGTLEYGEDSVVWQVFEEGEYTLTARRGLRTRTVTYTVNVTEDGLSVLKAR